MNKKELVSKTVEVLRENNIRKQISAQKTVLHISDDCGNKSDFVIKRTDKGVLFNGTDVTAIIDACLAVIEDSIKHGESVAIHGFGTLGLHYRAARTTKHPESGLPVDVDARYVPKFNFGNNLRMAAKVYELSLSDRDYDEEDGD